MKDDLISRQAAIDKFIDALEEIFSDIREKHVDDSVCGLCEYDGAYIGQSGDWCNECPGFDRDDCFKLSDKTRKKWTDEIIKAFPSIQPEQRWIPCTPDTMPEEAGTYLCTCADAGRLIVTLIKWQPRMKSWNLTGSRTYWKVIAWMPLPEPYQPKEE